MINLDGFFICSKSLMDTKIWRQKMPTRKHHECLLIGLASSPVNWIECITYNEFGTKHKNDWFSLNITYIWESDLVDDISHSLNSDMGSKIFRTNQVNIILPDVKTVSRTRSSALYVANVLAFSNLMVSKSAKSAQRSARRNRIFWFDWG